MYIDTHCHLDYFKGPLKELLDACALAHVEKMISISVDVDNVKKVVELATIYSNIYGTLGLHPHEAKHWTKDLEQYFCAHQSNPKIVAIGEIGLDYFYMHSSKEEQISVFEKQLLLASNWNMPVVIHSRDAEEDTMSVLAPFLKHLPSVVFHSFSSSIKLAEFAIENQCFMGFTGMVTFKNADNVRQAVELTPLNKLVIETDAPFLTPAPHRGKENTSAYLPLIAEKVAHIKKMTLEELKPQLWKNTINLFPKIAN